MDPDRRELERLAFAKPTTEQDAARAADALHRLVDADAAEAAARTSFDPAPTERTPAIPEPVPPATDADPTAPARRRSPLPLVIAIGLVVGLAAGILVTRGAPALFVASTTPTAAPPSPTPVLGATTNALAQLEAPRTPADAFPLPDFATELDLDGSSIHRVLTTADGASLWIARTANALCMMVTNDDTDGTADHGAATGAGVGTAAASTCASLFDFSDSGLKLTYGGDTWSWDGSRFTTTIGR